MLKRLVGAMAVSAFIIAGLAVDASAFSEQIGTKISLVKPGKLYKIVSKPVKGTTFPIPGPALNNPLNYGGSVKVTLNGGELNCNLWAGYWDEVGSLSRLRGWKYLNKEAPGGDGACKRVLLKPTVIKVLAKATGTLVVNGKEANGDLSLELVAGEDNYCALATPPHHREIEGRLLKAKDALPPAECPGSPSGAFVDVTTDVLN